MPKKRLAVRLRTKDPKLMRDPKVRAWLRECEIRITEEVEARLLEFMTTGATRVGIHGTTYGRGK